MSTHVTSNTQVRSSKRSAGITPEDKLLFTKVQQALSRMSRYFAYHVVEAGGKQAGKDKFVLCLKAGDVKTRVFSSINLKAFITKVSKTTHITREDINAQIVEI